MSETVYRAITARVVAELAGGRPNVAPNTFVRDNTLPGFAVRIGATKSSYIVQGKQGRTGKTVRYTLGSLGKLDLAEARAQAKEKIAMLARGGNPIEERRKERGVAITFRQALQLLADQRDVKASTVADYEKALNALGWMDRRLHSVKPADVLAAYDARRATPTSAGRIFRSMRSVWNAARAVHPTLPESPTSSLRNVRRKWSVAPRKQRLIADAMLPLWRKQVAALQHEGVRDLLLFLHYSGCRVGETRAIRARDVDLRGGCFTLADPKNGKPVTLPLTKQTKEIVARRIADPADADGHLFPAYDVRKLHKTVDAAPWSNHDLRRGFITTCHRLGVDNTIARRLTNHVTSADDAHSGYIVTDPDSLRPEAQRVNDHLDRLARRRS